MDWKKKPQSQQELLPTVGFQPKCSAPVGTSDHHVVHVKPVEKEPCKVCGKSCPGCNNRLYELGIAKAYADGQQFEQVGSSGIGVHPVSLYYTNSNTWIATIQRRLNLARYYYSLGLRFDQCSTYSQFGFELLHHFGPLHETNNFTTVATGKSTSSKTLKRKTRSRIALTLRKVSHETVARVEPVE